MTIEAQEAAGLQEKPAQAIKAEELPEDRMAAWLDGRIPRRLRAIPFGGPIPSPLSAKGVDLDGEFFSPRTDIKAEWLEFRVTDWHHGHDPILRRTTIGKADGLAQEDDGWWVNLWLVHGEKRLALIRKLVEMGGELFGSSESVAGMVKKASTGEILQWPYWRQTLTTSPQNTLSVLQPLKASLETAILDGNTTARFWADVENELRRLGTDLRATSHLAGKSGATDGPTVDQAMTRLARSLDSLGNAVTGGPRT